MTALKDASVHDASTAVRSGAKVIGSIVYLFSINWKLATMITALVPVLSISAKLYGRHAKGKVKQVRQAMSDAAAVRCHRSHACCILARLVFASLNGGGAAAAAHAPACVQLCEESLSNIRTVRSFTQEAQREAVFVRALARAAEEQAAAGPGPAACDRLLAEYPATGGGGGGGGGEGDLEV